MVREMAIVIGTRPETLKMAPIINLLRAKGFTLTLVHTGQHHDYELCQQFIYELGLPHPSYNLKLNEETPAGQIGEMMVKLEKILNKSKPRLLLIQGDTNTMLASALTGVKLGIKICHVESGLRSYDWRMPEEHNRRMVDHISDILFAPTSKAETNLIQENVQDKVYVTGNTVIDTLTHYMPMAAKKSRIMDKVEYDEYAVVTIHRTENVDDPNVLKNFVQSLIESTIPIVFPIHPRTNKRLRQRHLFRKLRSSKNIQILPPVGYFDMLMLMKNCRFMMTDSGGLQEEATAPSIRKPVLVLRLSTERPEAVETGFARLVGVEKSRILEALNNLLDKPPRLPHKSPFGDGRAAERILRIVERWTR